VKRRGTFSSRMRFLFYALFFRLLKPFIGLYLKKKFNVQGINRKLLATLEPPYFIMPNHVGFWDPFLVASLVPHPVFWVTSDAQFRSPILRRALALVGAIPKTKGRADTETIKQILFLRSNDAVVGIFPEGVRTWDGHSLPIVPATAKLVRLARVPVVVPRIRGGFLSDPRWSRKSRRGKIEIEFQLAVSAAETRTLSVAEIGKRIQTCIDNDSYEFQLDRKIPYRGSALAENVEKALFICPRCKAIATLRSKGELLSCLSCGYSVEYSHYGFLDTRSREFFFSSIHEWNQWQLRELGHRLVDLDPQGPALFDDGRVWLWTGIRRMPIQRFRIGRLLLYKDRVEFRWRRKGLLVWPIQKIDGINVQNRERLEFYVEHTLFHFQFKRKCDSSYKWQEAVRMIQDGLPEGK